MKFTIITLAAATLAFSGCQSRVLDSEPAAGQLRSGQKVLVDDGSCPSGQVKEVRGAPSRNVGRQRSCVPRPAS